MILRINGKEIKATPGCCALDYIGEFGGKRPVAVRVNNEVCALREPIYVDATIEAVLGDEYTGAAVYRRTLCFALQMSFSVLKINKRLIVGHSLGYGYYYTLGDEEEVSEELLSKIQDKMAELVGQNLPINIATLSWQQAQDEFTRLGFLPQVKQLNLICNSTVKVNKVTLKEGSFYEVFHAPLLEATGALKIYELRKYDKGFLLRFPQSATPDLLPEFKDHTKLFNVYKLYKSWGRRVKVASIADLNETIKDGRAEDFINLSETLQDKVIGNIASAIMDRGGVRVVLIAGPSSSGKTTTSKKLALQLMAIGYNPKVISLDNYYVGRESNPKDKDGNYDYECLEALDIKQLNGDLLALFNGEEVPIPSYDFKAGQRYYDGHKIRLHEDDILVMEGIHALNDKLTPLISPRLKFKLYISALTQLNYDDHTRISTTDNRLIRRIVRDANYRGKSASDTIGMWPIVTRGERLHIFPFQDNADAMLNTALDYELAVLKVWAEPLLQRVNPRQKQYGEAQRLLSFISGIYPIPETQVPRHSIIREFIGGSLFSY